MSYTHMDRNRTFRNCRMGYAYWKPHGYGETQGGFYIPFTKKDVGQEEMGQFPYMGSSMAQCSQGAILISCIALIGLTIQDPENYDYIYSLVGLSCLLGVLFVIPIGGADMPVVVSSEFNVGNCRSFHRFRDRKQCPDYCWLYGGSSRPNTDFHYVQSDEQNPHCGPLQVIRRGRA